MRRIVFGAVLLVVLLGLGIFVSWGMNVLHGPITQTLDKAAEEALHGGFAHAVKLGQEAKARWQAKWNITASLADHSPMDEIDGLFAQLDAYAREEEKTHYAACCRELSSLIQAVAEAHSPSWWNLL